jgi:hypothetical protein
MTYEPLNRRLALLAASFAFLGVILGAIALATNYWTIGRTFDPIYNGTSVVGQQEISYTTWNVCIVFLSFLNDYQMNVVFLFCIFIDSINFFIVLLLSCIML